MNEFINLFIYSFIFVYLNVKEIYNSRVNDV